MKKTLLTLLCLLVLQNTFAQTDTCKSNNWYFNFALGEGVTITDNLDNMKCPDFLSHRLSLGFGKWLTPWLGIKLQGVVAPLCLQHRTSDNFSDNYLINEYVNDVDAYGYYLAKAPFVNTHISLQLSLLSMFGNTQSRWDALLSVGAGYIHVFPQKGIPSYDGTTLNPGLMAKCRLSKHWELDLEATADFLSDKFDARNTDNDYALNTALNIGATYFFGNGRCFQKRNPAEIKTTNPIYIRDTVRVPEYVEKIVEVTKESSPGQALAAFSYEIGSIYPIGNLSETTMKQIVKTLQDNPTKKLRLESYSDKETGSEKRNMELAIQRITYLRNVLIYEYSIPSEKITERPYGSSVQLFNSNETSQNRITWVFLVDE